MDVPSGIILIWSGAIGNIPVGWFLCDGNNGTPDLRDSFVVGAGDTYNPDDVGGSTTHNHTFTTDGHLHSILGGLSIDANTGFVPQTDVQTDSGTTGNSNNLPPFYSLAYIMKS